MEGKVTGYYGRKITGNNPFYMEGKSNLYGRKSLSPHGTTNVSSY